MVHFSDVNAAHIIRDHVINCGSGTGCIPLPNQSRLTCFLGPILVEVLQRQNIILRLYFFQGHPMDLFLKISVLHANFCWLGDVEEIIVLGRKVLLGKR